MAFFFAKFKFFKKIYIPPQKFMVSICSKHQKRNLHEGLTILTSSQTKWRAFENAMCTFYPPTLLGLKLLTLIYHPESPKHLIKSKKVGAQVAPDIS